jgi:hypothetical protein
MIDPNKDDVGKTVIYHRNGTRDVGVVESFNEHYVFVRYGTELNCKATLRADLDWLDGEEA